MNRSPVAAVALLFGLGAPLVQDPAKPVPAKSDTAPVATLGASNVDKLGKMVRSYYGYLDQESLAKAKKDLDKLVDESGKIAKAQKLADPLLALEDWREIVKRGLTVEKPTVSFSSLRAELKLVALPEDQTPVKTGLDAKDLQGVFDNKLKAFVSVPSDFAKVAYPVVVGLHPLQDEVHALKDMKKSKDVIEEVDRWSKATYSKEFLAKAIVICPVMDLVVRSSDQVSYARPHWESDEGAAWVFRALSRIIFPNVNYDPRRVFLDGSGSGSAAALLFCAQFPGLQTGAIARGPVPEKIDFENCLGTPILLVGPDAKAFGDTWKGKDGFLVETKDSLDDATLLQWMTDHPKVFAPKRITLKTNRLEFASSYWFKVTDQDRSKEGMGFVVDAVVDRDKNTITVVTNEKVKAFEIYLNDDLLDLSKEVRVVHRRSGAADAPEIEKFKGVLKRAVEDALEWAFKGSYGNTGEVYTACIQVELE
jgi:hypothetical protein